MLRRSLGALLALALAAPADASRMIGISRSAPARLPAAAPAALGGGAASLSTKLPDAPSLGGSLSVIPDALTTAPAAAQAPAAAVAPARAALPAARRLRAARPVPRRPETTLAADGQSPHPTLGSIQALSDRIGRKDVSHRQGASAPLSLFFDRGARFDRAADAPLARPGRRRAGALRPGGNPADRAVSEPPAPETTPSLFRGWGPGGWSYIGYLSAVIAGLAVYSPIFPGMAIERFGAAAYGLAASLAVLAMPPAAALARKLGNALGMQKGLALSLLGAGAASAGLFTAFAADSLPWAGLLAGLVVVQGLFASMRTLDKAIPSGLYGRNQKKLQAFNALSFSLSRIPGILIPFFIAPLLTLAGTYGTLAVFPAALLAAVPVVLSIKTDSTTKKNEPGTENDPGDAEILRLSGWGFATQQVMTYVLPFILASGYGAYAFPLDPTAAKAVAGMLFGSWTVGALLGTLYLMGVFRALFEKAGYRFRTLSPVEGMRRAAWIGALGFAGFLPLLQPYAPLLYAGAVLAGFGSASSFLVFLSGAQANAPSRDRAGAISRYMTLSFASIAAIVWGVGSLLQLFPGSPLPFAFLLAILGGFAAINVRIALRLKNKELR
jgi:hypothetical protein